MLDVPAWVGPRPSCCGVGATAGIGANIGPLLARLGAALASQGVNVRNIVSVFDGETAVALSPEPSPALLIVARLRDEAAARSELASLEAPLTALFSPSGAAAAGQVPELADAQVGGATVHEVQLGAGLQVDFGVFDGLASCRPASARSPTWRSAATRSAATAPTRRSLPAGSGPGPVSSLVFGDFTRILSLGEQTGLTSGARTRELLPDLSKIRTVGVSSTSGKNDTTTDLTPRDSMTMIADNEFLFTSESVTEGHPDKVADQISDGVLDAVLRDDPTGRVACETLVNTGLVVVSGRDHDHDVRGYPGGRAGDDQADRLYERRVRVRLPHVRGDQRDRQAVAGYRAGRRSGVGGADEPGRRRRARRGGRG